MCQPSAQAQSFFRNPDVVFTWRRRPDQRSVPFRAYEYLSKKGAWHREPFTSSRGPSRV